MSIRCDTSSLISGAIVCGDRGLGVLGSQIPSSGDSGAGYLYNDLSIPSDNGKEVRGLIVSAPSSGSFFAYEDSSFEFSGAPDGLYSFTYRLFVDGEDLGTAVSTLTVGASNVDIYCNISQAIANGYSAALYQDAYILCGVSIASSVGYSANVSINQDIYCSASICSAYGYQSSILGSSAINCTNGIAYATGYQCEINSVSDGYFYIDPTYNVVIIDYTYNQSIIDPEYWN